MFNISGLAAIRKAARLLLPALVALFAASAANAQNSAAYQNFSDLTGSLRALADSHKDLARLESIGKTAGGRELWVLTLAKEGAIPVGDRPGLLIAAGFEGDHLAGSSLCLETARFLLDGYASDPEIRKRLDAQVFYIIPRMNPDGAEAMFGQVVTGTRANSTPFDADNDGRLDEDGPEDLNGDGIITVMRVKDISGLYRIDPDEPMLMKKAEAAKGERGEYALYMEGIDNDKDGFINEDPPGGTDLNRNFMHAYPYFKENAGRHMVSETETRALLDWMLVHKNIATVLTFGESDNLITAPAARSPFTSDRPLDLVQFPAASNAGAGRVGMVSDGFRGGRGRFMFGDFPGGMFQMGGTQQETSSRSQRQQIQPATTVNAADLEYFTKASEKYKELTGISVQPPLRNPEGAFFQYAYFQLGVPAFCTPGWGLVLPQDSTRRPGSRTGMRPGGSEGGNTGRFAMGGGSMRGGGSAGAQAAGTGEEGGPTPGIDATFYKHLTANNIDGFVKWQAVKHPELGEVEIGGFKPLYISNPPAEKLSELGASHAKFALYLSGLFASVKIDKTEVIAEGGGLFRIRAEITNEGFLPTALRQGVTARSVKPTMVQLEVKPEQIVSGSSKTNFFQALDGSGRRMKYEWLVKAKKGDTVKLRVVSQKGGTDTAIIKLS